MLEIKYFFDKAAEVEEFVYDGESLGI